MSRPQPLAWLPNTHGFTFTGICKDGRRARCRVERAPDGTYRVADGMLAELMGWVP